MDASRHEMGAIEEFQPLKCGWLLSVGIDRLQSEETAKILMIARSPLLSRSIVDLDCEGRKAELFIFSNQRSKVGNLGAGGLIHRIDFDRIDFRSNLTEY